MNNAEKYATISAVAGFAAFAIAFARLGITKSVFIIPVAIILPIAVYFQFKPKKIICSPEILMNELPSAVGMFSIVLSSGGSFDSAVRNISENGPTNLSKMFKDIVMNADCRVIPDIKTGIDEMLLSLPKELSVFRRAMVLIETAFDTGDKEKRNTIMKDAEKIVLNGLKETGEMYSAKLNMPCMLIFGIGIMIPMILVSVLPMLEMGGQFSTEIDSGTVALVTLVAVPAFVSVVLLSLKGKNPFFVMSNKPTDYVPLLGLLTAIPMFIILEGKISKENALTVSLIISGTITAVFMIPSVMKERSRRKIETMLEDCIFELANRLMSGENFDSAMKKSLGAKHCSDISDRYEKETALCRGDVESAIKKVIGPISDRISEFLCEIYRESLKDLRDSGKLALGIAHQIQDQNSVRKEIEIKLKNMLDMMNGSAAIFAPLILGISLVMLGPISELSGGNGIGEVKQIIIVYLVELCALISVLSTNLLCKGKMTDILFRFSVTVPVSLIVFTMCTSMSM